MDDAPGVWIRSATTDDQDDVRQLAADLATSHAVDPDAFPAIFGQAVDDPGVLLVVAEQDETVIGYLLGQRHHTFHANGPVVWVEELMVAGDHRRSGAGRALMAEAERWARDQGAAYVSLATRRAGDFYAALGYEASATYMKRIL